MGSTTTLGGIGGTGIGNGGIDWSKLLTAGFGGLQGLQGLFPTPVNQNTKTTSQSNQSQSGYANTYGSSDVNSLLQNLSSLNTTNRGTSSGGAGVTPTLSPESAQFMNQLINQYSGLAARAPNLAPYQAQQTQGINQQANTQNQAVQQIIASRGLATSPIAATAALNTDANRLAQISALKNSIPILRNTLERGSLQEAGNFFSTLPRGQQSTFGQTNLAEGAQTGETSQSGKTTGVTTSDQNFGSASSAWQQTLQELLKKEGGGIGGFLQGLLPVLATLIP